MHFTFLVFVLVFCENLVSFDMAVTTVKTLSALEDRRRRVENVVTNLMRLFPNQIEFFL